MTRQQLEHVIRAAAQIVDDPEVVVVGSQAILGQYPNAPASLLVSNEADVFPKNKPDLADLIDGTIGELSPFHQTFGYYAQGVAETTATLPEGWKARLIRVHNANTMGATGWCLEIHDLVVSKLVAGREKDLTFAKDAARFGLLEESTVAERVAKTSIPAELRGCWSKVVYRGSLPVQMKPELALRIQALARPHDELRLLIDVVAVARSFESGTARDRRLFSRPPVGGARARASR